MLHNICHNNFGHDVKPWIHQHHIVSMDIPDVNDEFYLYLQPGEKKNSLSMNDFVACVFTL